MFFLLASNRHQYGGLRRGLVCVWVCVRLCAVRTCLVHCGNSVATCSQLITGWTSHIQSYVGKVSCAAPEHCIYEYNGDQHQQEPELTLVLLLPYTESIDDQHREEKKLFHPVHWQQSKLTNNNHNNNGRHVRMREVCVHVCAVAISESFFCVHFCAIALNLFAHMRAGHVNGQQRRVLFNNINRIDCFYGFHHFATHPPVCNCMSMKVPSTAVTKEKKRDRMSTRTANCNGYYSVCH